VRGPHGQLEYRSLESGDERCVWINEVNNAGATFQDDSPHTDRNDFDAMCFRHLLLEVATPGPDDQASSECAVMGDAEVLP